MVIGDSPVAAALTGLAPRVGLQVTLVAQDADADALPRRRRRAPSDDAAALAPRCAPGTWVVVATQGRRDVQALRAALALQARAGVLRGQRPQGGGAEGESWSKRASDAEAVAAIVAPGGPADRRATPAEIALSVLAAVVRPAARRGGSAGNEPTGRAEPPAGPRRAPAARPGDG